MGVPLFVRTKPYIEMLRVKVDLSYLADLMTSLWDIRLIDANCICLNNSAFLVPT